LKVFWSPANPTLNQKKNRKKKMPLSPIRTGKPTNKVKPNYGVIIVFAPMHKGTHP